MTITELVLGSEEYVDLRPELKETAEYKVAYAIKEEIRKHKWIEAEKGRSWDWATAREDWMENYYGDFIAWLKPFKPAPKKRKTAKDILVRKTRLREPVITGGYV